MGRVLRARDSELDRPVAIKLMLGELAAHPRLRARFEREARALARVHHPHVIPVLDSGEADGTLYLVLAFVEGTDLERELSEHPDGLPTEEADRLLGEILEGTAAAHEAEVLHRDLKPANVLLDGDGRAMLTDFGLARLGTEATLTETGTVMGTPLYMPPDQLAGEKPGPDADLHAAALIYLQMLTGGLPFPDGSLGELLEAKRRGIDLRRELRGRQISPALGDVLQACLSPDPAARPADPAELLEALRGGSRPGKDPGSAATIRVASTAPEPPPHTPRPHSWLPGALLLFAVLLGSAAVLLQPATPPPIVRPVPDPLEALLRELRRDETIAAALELTPPLPEGHITQTYALGRSRYRRLLREHVRALEGLTGERSVFNLVQQVLLFQELLDVPGEEWDPLYESLELPGLRAYTAGRISFRHLDRLGSYHQDDAGEGLERDHRILEEGGRRWRAVFRPGKRRNDAGELVDDDDMRVRTMSGALFPNSVPDIVDPKGVSTTSLRRLRLHPFSGELRLIFFVYDWGETPVTRLRFGSVAGEEELLLVRRHPPMEDPDLYRIQAYELRVPAELLPSETSLLSLEVLGVIPVGNPSPTVNLEAVLQQVAGPPLDP